MVSWWGIILVLLATGGNFSNDLISVLDAADYFKARKIEVTAASMTELAGKEPGENKEQIAQLLAIRWLGEHPALAKKQARARETLQQIAAGKKAQDTLGFAKEYAQRSLALIEGKPLPLPPPMPENSLRHDAVQWFPDDATFFGGLDFRGAGDASAMTPEAVRSLLVKHVPERAKQEFFQFAEAVGNFRIDRACFAYCAELQPKKGGRIFARLTGLGDRKGWAEFMKQHLRDAKVEYRKGPKGEIITVISSENQAPAYALIGETEVLLAGYDKDESAALEVLEEALDVRAGKKPNILNGSLGAHLKNISPRANGLLVGDLTAEMRRDLARNGPFQALPTNIVLEVLKSKGLAVRMQADMADAEDAKSFAASVEELKKQGTEGLKNIPPQIKVKPETLEILSKALNGIKVEAKEAKVAGGVQISPEVIKALHGLLETFLEMRGRPEPAPPRGVGAKAKEPV